MNKTKYYNLKQLLQIVDLKERALKYRMNYVKIKYKDRNDLLFKNGRSWNIHESIIFEFDRKKRTKKELKKMMSFTIKLLLQYHQMAIIRLML